MQDDKKIFLSELLKSLSWTVLYLRAEGTSLWHFWPHERRKEERKEVGKDIEGVADERANTGNY